MRFPSSLIVRVALALTVVAGSVALLCVAIGTTTFDGFSNGPVWASLNPDLQSFFKDLGLSITPSIELAGTVGLIGCVAAVGFFYWLGVRGMTTVGRGHDTRELARRLHGTGITANCFHPGFVATRVIHSAPVSVGGNRPDRSIGSPRKRAMPVPDRP